MQDNYTPQDHERMIKISEKILHEYEYMPDPDFGVLVTNLMIELIMRLPPENRQLGLVKIMTAIKKVIREQ